MATATKQIKRQVVLVPEMDEANYLKDRLLERDDTTGDRLYEILSAAINAPEAA